MLKKTAAVVPDDEERAAEARQMDSRFSKTSMAKQGRHRKPTEDSGLAHQVRNVVNQYAQYLTIIEERSA
ncbi:hypothetical protein GQ600_391 [Phytophthora cactorum]|nr:hypothetical protein GQ600_391 [Phytophthora cactorum]